jgi:hypothetical protein
MKTAVSPLDLILLNHIEYAIERMRLNENGSNIFLGWLPSGIMLLAITSRSIPK